MNKKYYFLIESRHSVNSDFNFMKKKTLIKSNTKTKRNFQNAAIYKVRIHLYMVL